MLRDSRTANEPGARRIASAFYPDLATVQWIPSDDADVFRLTFTSGRASRILKMATRGIPAVWREIGAFPAMKRLGVPEVLQFEYTTDDLPEVGLEFHITRALGNPKEANRALAGAWAHDRRRALEIATWLGDCTRRIEGLDWRDVPRANPPEIGVLQGDDWLKPQHACLTSRSDCPAWVVKFLRQTDEELSRLPQRFGGWAGEMLLAVDGGFVLIDWPGLGAAHDGSQAAAGFDVLLRFGADDPSALVDRFLEAWAPEGVDKPRLELLRRRWAHNILWWAGLGLQMGGGDSVDILRTYADAAYVFETDDPAAWLRPADSQGPSRINKWRGEPPSGPVD
jgi:hypothetical protein